jgi:Bacterial extracellular solute-binding protein
MRRIVGELAETFHRETGHPVALTTGTVGALTARATAGEAADVFVLTDAGIDDLVRQGLVVPGTRVDLARTAVGVGVRRGAPLPDISTPDALRDTLLRVTSCVYIDPAHGGTSGSTSPTCSGGWVSPRLSATRRSSGPAGRPPRRSSAARPSSSCTSQRDPGCRGRHAGRSPARRAPEGHDLRGGARNPERGARACPRLDRVPRPAGAQGEARGGRPGLPGVTPSDQGRRNQGQARLTADRAAGQSRSTGTLLA